MSPNRLRIARLSVLLAALFCGASYAYFIAAGKPTDWPSYSRHYDSLAEGFRAGHLHLAEEPSEQLMRQPNPYDPRLRHLWKWDITLHDGKYYLYWGPVPAALLAVVKSTLGIEQPVEDYALVLCFLLVRLAAGTWLMWALLRRCFPAAPLWLAPVGTLLMGWASPVPFFASRSSIYEASIAGGQAFVVLGFALAFEAQLRERSRAWLFALASGCWGLAVGCRVSLALALAVVTGVTCVTLLYRRHRERAAWLEVAATGLPIATAVALLGLYNYLRFGSVRDFGLDEQLSTMKFTFSFVHFPANLYSYLFRELALTCQFPFVRVPSDLGAAAFPEGFPLPDGHAAGEPVLGLLVGLPFLVLAFPAALAGASPRLRKALWSSGAAGSTRGTLAAWTIVVASILATLPLLPALGLWMATIRYEVDIVAAIVLLGIVGAAVLLVQSRGVLRWASAALVVALACYSLLVGLLLGFQGYYDHFQRHNPELFQAWQTMKVCER